MHAFANPARFLTIARPLTGWFGWLLRTDRDRLVGVVSPRIICRAERAIMYVHLPSAWLSWGWTGIAVAIDAVVFAHPLAGSRRAHGSPVSPFTALCPPRVRSGGRPTWHTGWDGRMNVGAGPFCLYVAYMVLPALPERECDGLIIAMSGGWGEQYPIPFFGVWWRTFPWSSSD